MRAKLKLAFRALSSINLVGNSAHSGASGSTTGSSGTGSPTASNTNTSPQTSSPQTSSPQSPTSAALGSRRSASNTQQASPKTRFNAFKDKGTPNEVIFQSNAPDNSVGWNEHEFFSKLGAPSEEELEAALDSANSPEEIKQIINDFVLKQRTAQEYLLQGIPKGALMEARRIAMENGRFISIRPTGVAAHPGIESGSPTKAQEFKNKTSKAMDVLLSDEIGSGDIGAVVHYDPRVGWSSPNENWTPFPKKPLEPTDKSDQAAMRQYEQDLAVWNQAFEAEWAKKREYIETVRKEQLQNDINKGRIEFPSTETEWTNLKNWFESRLTEYTEEDPEYRDGGHYAEHVHLSGPFIHLAVRPDEHMYGDHDLFGFGVVNDDGTVTFKLDNDAEGQIMQHDLQLANTFQAQHGGIWNWQPDTPFNQAIKDKIMGAHSPPKGEPLIVVQPDGTVEPMFYIAPDSLESAWDHPEATKWLESTHSGKQLLATRQNK